MKRYIILFAMLAAALTISAQQGNPGRTRTTEDKKENTRSSQGNNNSSVRESSTSNSNSSVRQESEKKETVTPSRESNRTTTSENKGNAGQRSSQGVRGNSGENRSTSGVRNSDGPVNNNQGVRNSQNRNQGNNGNNQGVRGNNSGNGPSHQDNNGVRSRGENSNRGGNEYKSNNGVRDRGESGVRSRGQNSNRGNNEYYRGNTGNQGNNGVRNRGESSVRNRGQNSNNDVRREAGDYTTVERVYTPRSEQEYAATRRTYVTPERHVVVVRPRVEHRNYVYHPIEYRRTYYPYRVPSRPDIIWSVRLYNEYSYLYPDYDYWYYPVGYRIHTVSTYDADRYIGEFARIYGEVYDVWYSGETNEYYLYFGGPYPYQDFTVIMNAFDARRFSRRPERFFTGRHIAVTGIVSVYENKPEMLIKRVSQVDLYN